MIKENLYEIMNPIQTPSLDFLVRKNFSEFSKIQKPFSLKKWNLETVTDIILIQLSTEFAWRENLVNYMPN